MQIREGCPYQALAEDTESKARPLPPILITVSESDARVPQWGPIKWALRARARRRADVLVAPELHAGHAAHEAERLEVAACLQAWAMLATGTEEA